MKKKVFDRLVERELKKFKNYVMSDFMTKFIMDMSIDYDNYIRHNTASGNYFGMHFYPFWHDPNQEDFTGIIDSYILEYMVCTMYTHDPEKKFRYMLVGASSLFLGILMFGEEKERDIMFHSMINLIKEYIAMEYSVNYQDTTLQEAFLLYDIYTGGKNHDLWTPYVTKPLSTLYQDCMDNILSDDEEKVKTLLSDMLEYHVKQSNNDNFVRSEFTYPSQRVFPLEILALIHYRHTQGKSIDFIDDQILSVFVPYIKANDFRPSPAVEKARNDMYVLLGIK